MKKTVCGFIVGFLLATSVTAVAVELVVNPNPFPILVDGLTQDIEAYNINGYTFIKLSEVGLATNTLVEFNTDKKQVEISTGFLNKQNPTSTPPAGNIAEETGGVNMEDWVSLRELSKQNVSVVIDDETVISRDGKELIFPMGKSTLAGEDTTLPIYFISTTSNATLMIHESSLYLKRSDIYLLGL